MISKKAVGSFLVVLNILINPVTAHIRPYIVGGSSADIKNYPYQVSLIFNNEHQCGASIIHEKIILTAAHCVKGINSNMTIRAGSSFAYKGGTIYKVTSIYIHPLFDPIKFDYDIALLKISEKIIFDETKQPIQLPNNKTNIANGTKCHISGWGQLYPRGPFSADLQAATLNIVDHDRCQSQYLKMPFFEANITDRMICAYAPNRDACARDSGGPLVCSGRQVGIVSWGYGCAQPKFPGVYSKIQSLMDFVFETIYDVYQQDRIENNI